MGDRTTQSTNRRAYHVPECHMARIAGRLRRVTRACEEHGVSFSCTMDRGYVAQGHDEDEDADFMCRIRIMEVCDGVDLGDLRVAGVGRSVDGEWETALVDIDEDLAAMTAHKTENEPSNLGDSDDELDEFDMPDPDEVIPYGDAIPPEMRDADDEPRPLPPVVTEHECERCGSSASLLCVIEDTSTGEYQEICARCLSEAAGGLGTSAARDYAELMCLLARLSGSRGLAAVPATRRVLPADLFVACCLASVRRHGYVSGKKSIRDMTWQVADRMACCVLGLTDADAFPQHSWDAPMPEEIQALVDSDDTGEDLLAEAREAMEWMLSSFYTADWADAARDAIRRSMRDNLVERRDEGLLASFSRGWLIHCRDRSVRAVAEVIRSEAGVRAEQPIGEPGDHVTVPVAHAMEIDRWPAPSGMFLRCIYILVTDRGDLVMWRTAPNPWLGSADIGRPDAIGHPVSFKSGELSLSARVVRHEEYDGKMQTVVTNGRLSRTEGEAPTMPPPPSEHVHTAQDAVGLRRPPRRPRKWRR